MVDFPAPKERTTDIPPLALAIRRQNECALPRTHQNSYSAHLILPMCEFIFFMFWHFLSRAKCFLSLPCGINLAPRLGGTGNAISSAAYFSAVLFMFAGPVSNSLPSKLSMLINTCMTFEMKGAGPRIAQVTFVESPSGASVNSAVLCPSIGLRKSSLIVTLEGADASVISIRPLPTLELPSHSYTAPLPLAAPLRVLFIAGSTFSQGDQEFQLLKSLMRGNILSGGALIFVVRCTLKESGLVIAKPRTPAIRATTTIAIILNIDPSAG